MMRNSLFRCVLHVITLTSRNAISRHKRYDVNLSDRKVSLPHRESNWKQLSYSSLFIIQKHRKISAYAIFQKSSIITTTIVSFCITSRTHSINASRPYVDYYSRSPCTNRRIQKVCSMVRLGCKIIKWVSQLMRIIVN